MNIYENKTRKNHDKSAVQRLTAHFSGRMGSMGSRPEILNVRCVRDFHRALQYGAGTIPAIHQFFWLSLRIIFVFP
jgi:hypothetical protein